MHDQVCLVLEVFLQHLFKQINIKSMNMQIINTLLYVQNKIQPIDYRKILEISYKILQFSNASARDPLISFERAITQTHFNI